MARVFLILFSVMAYGCSSEPAEDARKVEQSAPQPAALPVDQLDELLRNRIEAAGVPPHLTVGMEKIHASVVLPLFYERRAYKPAWSNAQGVSANADSLLQILREADREGLHPDDYHLRKISALLDETRQPMQVQNQHDLLKWIDLDLVLTDAFLIYGAHLLAGKINPQSIDAEWYANRREADLAALLQNALEQNKIGATLRNLLPPQSGYARLKKALTRYRRLALDGGWPMVPDRTKLQKGDSSASIAILNQRLIAAGDLEPNAVKHPAIFDEALERAVRKFQQRHGLDADGVAGTGTLVTMNVPVEERIRQVILNMERWRWLPQDLGTRYILVNIANFELEVVESEQVVLDMRVMVGKDYRRTPVFSDKMTYLVLCPYWHVPYNIAVQDKLPLIKKDPGYLAKQHMKMFLGWGESTNEIEPQTVDWSKITTKSFNYRLRQDPGPTNALGRAKFMFPNPFNVYLHDTPARELFAKTERAFSSGCIRIEKPVDLAAYLLRQDPNWTRAKLDAAILKWNEQTIRLANPIDVHLLYWTAWANEDGSISFRRDIYGRDKSLAEALRETPPTPEG